MNESGIWFKPDFVARIELMTFAEHRDDLLAAELGEHLRLRARRFHHHDLGFRAVVGDGEMLGPDTIYHGLAVGIGGRVYNQELDAVWSFKTGAAVHPYLSLPKNHC